MYNSNCNQHDACNCGCASKCNRVGERIVVNRCGDNRNRCSCANTYRPGCGCNSCANTCPRPRPCPRPCPPKPSCEDRCREQYRHCMRNCRLREECHDYDDDNGHDNCNCSCHKD